MLVKKETTRLFIVLHLNMPSGRSIINPLKINKINEKSVQICSGVTSERSSLVNVAWLNRG